MPNIGPMELAIVLVIVLIFVGPKKLPGLGKSLGTGMREFKDSISGSDKDDALEKQAQKVENVATPAPLPAPAADPLAKPTTPAPAPEHAEPAPQPRDVD